MNMLSSLYHHTIDAVWSALVAVVAAPIRWTFRPAERVPLEVGWRLMLPAGHAGGPPLITCSSAISHQPNEWEDVRLWWDQLPEISTPAGAHAKCKGDPDEHAFAASIDAAMRNSTDLTSDYDCVARSATKSTRARPSFTV